MLILTLDALSPDEATAPLQEGDHVLGHQQGAEGVHLECLNKSIRGHVGQSGLTASAGVEDSGDIDGKVQLAVVCLDVLRNPGEALLPGDVALHGLYPLEVPEVSCGVRVSAASHHLDIAPSAEAAGKLQPNTSTGALDEGNRHVLKSVKPLN